MTIDELYQLPLDTIIRAAETHLISERAKYYPDKVKYYCPICGARVRKYQHYCGQCGQLLDGTFDGIKPEIISQEPKINNETGFVDWGEKEDE